LSCDTVFCQLTGNPATIASLENMLRARRDRNYELAAELSLVEAQISEFHSRDDDCHISIRQSADERTLAFDIDGGDANGLWSLIHPILGSLSLPELNYLIYFDRAGGVELSLGNTSERHDYSTGTGGKCDEQVLDAISKTDCFERLWTLARAGKMANRNRPKVGPVCAAVLTNSGHIEKDSKLHKKISKMKDVYAILAEVFPERASRFSHELGYKAGEQLELLRAHASAVPEWELENASIKLELLQEHESNPTYQVTVRFHSFGEDFEWVFEHWFPRKITYKQLFRDFQKTYLRDQIVPTTQGCVYVNAQLHSKILRALAPPSRWLKIIEDENYDAFYSLYDTLGYWATAMALLLPRTDGMSVQDYLDQHPKNKIALAWCDLN